MKLLKKRKLAARINGLPFSLQQPEDPTCTPAPHQVSSAFSIKILGKGQRWWKTPGSGDFFSPFSTAVKGPTSHKGPGKMPVKSLQLLVKPTSCGPSCSKQALASCSSCSPCLHPACRIRGAKPLCVLCACSTRFDSILLTAPSRSGQTAVICLGQLRIWLKVGSTDNAPSTDSRQVFAPSVLRKAWDSQHRAHEGKGSVEKQLFKGENINPAPRRIWNKRD